MQNHSQKIVALLGPTNTGKTHVAIEKMLEFDSGIFGLPLRLLAREVYDKCVKKIGSEKVALITGEEKIIPASANYFICTVESMPKNKAVDFEFKEPDGSMFVYRDLGDGTYLRKYVKDPTWKLDSDEDPMELGMAYLNGALEDMPDNFGYVDELPDGLIDIKSNRFKSMIRQDASREAMHNTYTKTVNAQLNRFKKSWGTKINSFDELDPNNVSSKPFNIFAVQSAVVNVIGAGRSSLTYEGLYLIPSEIVNVEVSASKLP